MGFSKKYIFFHLLNVTVQSAMTFTLSSYSSSPPLWSIRLEAMRLANLVDQLERLLNAATVFDSMAFYDSVSSDVFFYLLGLNGLVEGLSVFIEVNFAHSDDALRAPSRSRY